MDAELGVVVPEVHTSYLTKWIIPFFVGIMPTPLAAALMDQFMLPDALAAAGGLLEPRAEGTAALVLEAVEAADAARLQGLSRRQGSRAVGAVGAGAGGGAGGWSMLRWMSSRGATGDEGHRGMGRSTKRDDSEVGANANANEDEDEEEELLLESASLVERIPGPLSAEDVDEYSEVAPGVGGLAVLVRACLFLLRLLEGRMEGGATEVARALMTPRFLSESLRGMQPSYFVR